MKLFNPNCKKGLHNTIPHRLGNRTPTAVACFPRSQPCGLSLNNLPRLAALYMSFARTPHQVSLLELPLPPNILVVTAPLRTVKFERKKFKNKKKNLFLATSKTVAGLERVSVDLKTNIQLLNI